MKKTIAFVTALVAAVFILLTVVVTAVLYHGVYEDNVKVTLSEELDILSYLYETGLLLLMETSCMIPPLP